MKSNKAVLVSLFYLVISAAWAADPSSYASGTIGFTWEQREGPAALRVALPRVEASVGYGTPLWGWACFQVSEEGAQQAKVVIDVERNYWLKFPQEVDAISYGSLAVGHRRVRLELSVGRRPFTVRGNTGPHCQQNRPARVA